MFCLCINTAAAVWFHITAFCVYSPTSPVVSIDCLVGDQLWTFCNITQLLRSTKGPCFSLTLQNLSVTWRVLERMSSFFLFWVRLVRQHRDLLFQPCSDAVVYCRFSFLLPLLLFYSSVSQLTMSQHLLSLPIVCQLAC